MGLLVTESSRWPDAPDAPDARRKRKLSLVKIPNNVNNGDAMSRITRQFPATFDRV